MLLSPHRIHGVIIKFILSIVGPDQIIYMGFLGGFIHSFGTFWVFWGFFGLFWGFFEQFVVWVRYGVRLLFW